jgi:hypothetical protein
MKTLFLILFLLLTIDLISQQDKDTEKVLILIVNECKKQIQKNDKNSSKIITIISDSTVDFSKFFLDQLTNEKNNIGFANNRDSLLNIQKFDLNKIKGIPSENVIYSPILRHNKKIGRELIPYFKVYYISSPFFSEDRRKCFIEVREVGGSEGYLMVKQKRKWKIERIFLSYYYD